MEKDGEQRLLYAVLADCIESIRNNTRGLYNEKSKYRLANKEISKKDKSVQYRMQKELNEDLYFLNSRWCEQLCELANVEASWYRNEALKIYNKEKGENYETKN